MNHSHLAARPVFRVVGTAGQVRPRSTPPSEIRPGTNPVLVQVGHHLWVWGPAAVGAVFAAAVAFNLVRGLVWRWRHRRHTDGAHLIEIAAPPDVDPHSAAVLWTHLLGLLRPRWRRVVFGQPHLSFEYVATAHGLRVQVWVPGLVPAGIVEKAIRSAWPGAAVTTSPTARAPFPVTSSAAGGQLVPGRADCFPLKTGHDADPVRALCEAVTGLGPGEYAVVQVLARPATGRRLNRAHRTAAALRGARTSTVRGEMFDLLTPTTSSRGTAAGARAGELARAHPENAEQVRAILAKAAQPRWEITVRYAVATRRLPTPATSAWLRRNAHTVASVFALYTSGHQHLRRRKLHHPGPVLAARRLGRGFLASIDELAALAHLPHDIDAPGVTRAGARPVAPPPTIPTSTTSATDGVRVLGDADTGHARPVALGVAEARQHLHVLGETGVGKSTLLANLILTDAAAGRGVLVIDPKGDLVTDVLGRLPENAAGRCVVFDPADPTPPSINILAGPDPVFAVDAIVTIFHRCFTAAWGPRVDDLLRSTCLTLTCVHGRRACLGEVPLLLTDSAYRARTVARLDDELLRGFWDSYDALTPAGRASVIGPLMNKLRAVLLRPFVAHALASPDTTVDLGTHLDHGGIILARLPKGVLGDDAARLFGSLLIACTWQAITRRATTHQAQRPDAALYIDECHNFLNLPGSVSDVLAEARGYRLSLILAHQHLSQLPRDLREAISADARNKIYFTASPEDAAELRHHVTPVLSAHDLSHLGAYQAAARLITSAGPAAAFTFRTRPLPPVIPGREDQVRVASRARYATPTTRSPVRRRPTRAAANLADPRLTTGPTGETGGDGDRGAAGKDAA